MNTIKVLDNSLINKIAAGEVVDRPMSVVKEMVENSIDAGATAVAVEIEDGGTTKIRITDNGCGIPKEQLRTAFLRHATSKIASVDDLINVMTLGFRGEALSSIAAVSQLEVTTKTAGEITGSRISIEGGKVTSEGDVGCNTGTTMVIRNLFFNIPVRRKFLKRPSTEGAYISEIVEKIALGHPEIAIKYISGSRVVFQTNGNGDLKASIFNVYGSDISKKLIPIKFETNGFSLSGYVCRPECSKSSRNYENFFINGRYVKCEPVQNAVEDALKTRLMTGKFPVFVLNAVIQPELVDVNVHPTKMEVRFDSGTDVYQWVFDAVYSAFRSENLIPDVKLNANDPLKNVFESIYRESSKRGKTGIRQDEYDGEISLNEAVYDPAIHISETSEMSKDEALVTRKHLMDNRVSSKPVGKNSLAAEASAKSSQKEKFDLCNNQFFNSYKVIGQLFNTFWVVEQNDEMYVVDQHAAHERIKYEELIERCKSGEIYSQPLIRPEIIRLNDRERDILNENIKLFSEYGFDLKQLNCNDYEVRSVPYIFSSPAKSDFFTEILNWIDENKNISSSYDLKIEAIAKFACKAAVKANNRLGYIEAEAIIKKLMRMENPFNCPHGRPTIIKISRHEIEKMFMRVN